MDYLLAGTMIYLCRSGVVYWYNSGAIHQGQMLSLGYMVRDLYSMTLPIAGDYFGRFPVEAFELFPEQIKHKLLQEIALGCEYSVK